MVSRSRTTSSAEPRSPAPGGHAAPSLRPCRTRDSRASTSAPSQMPECRQVVARAPAPAHRPRRPPPPQFARRVSAPLSEEGEGCPARGLLSDTHAASARAAARNISSVMRCARRCDRAEPDAGKDVGVVALARDEACARRSSPGRTGCPRRTARGRRSTRRPRSAVHSDFDVGFDSAKMIGRSLSRAISSTRLRERAAGGGDADQGGGSSVRSRRADRTARRARAHRAACGRRARRAAGDHQSLASP